MKDIFQLPNWLVSVSRLKMLMYPCRCRGLYAVLRMGCLHDPANVQQTSSNGIQNTRANAGRLLDRVNTL